MDMKMHLKYSFEILTSIVYSYVNLKLGKKGAI